MIIDIENLGESLKVSHFTKDGEVAYLDLPIPERDRYVWKRASAGDRGIIKGWESWDNGPVKVQKTQKYDKYRITEILELYDKNITKPLWEYQTPKKYWVDIEVEVTDNKSDSLDTNKAANKILTLAIASSTGKVVVYGLRKLEQNQILRIEKKVNEHFKKFNAAWTFNYRSFDSEFDMIYTFMAKLMHKMPLISGWNWFGYDWPYLLSRAKRLGIDPKICSPSGVLLTKQQIPMHGLMVDYMEIYKKWDRVIKVRESNSLEYVAQTACGVGKVKYTGNLKTLYDDDFESYVFYNAVDSCLLEYIDKKLNTLSTFFKVALVTGVEINRALSPVWTTEVLMLREFLSRKKVILYEQKNEESRKFEGAVVKNPIKGLHEWISLYDFASLYPNAMIQFGISPEIYIGKNLENPPEGSWKTASGAYFKKQDGQEPVLRKVLKSLYALRFETKGKYKECEIKIEELNKILKQKQKEKQA